MTYPLLYVLIWILPTVIRVYQATSGDRAPFALGTIDKVRLWSSAHPSRLAAPHFPSPTQGIHGHASACEAIANATSTT